MNQKIAYLSGLTMVWSIVSFSIISYYYKKGDDNWLYINNLIWALCIYWYSYFMLNDYMRHKNGMVLTLILNIMVFISSVVMLFVDKTLDNNIFSYILCQLYTISTPVILWVFTRLYRTGIVNATNNIPVATQA
jgi:hypothetical protein